MKSETLVKEKYYAFTSVKTSYFEIRNRIFGTRIRKCRGVVRRAEQGRCLPHEGGNGTFHLINIAGAAFQSHIDHGDASPGDIVPAGTNFSFADDCTLIPACPCAVDLPSGWFASDSSGIGLELVCPDGSTIKPREELTLFNGQAGSGFPEELVSRRTQTCDEPPVFTCEAQNTTAGDVTRTISEAQYEACRSTTSVP